MSLFCAEWNKIKLAIWRGREYNGRKRSKDGSCDANRIEEKYIRGSCK